MNTIRPAPPILPNFIIPNAAASLLTTVSEYAIFLNAVLDPAHPALRLKPETRRQMWSAQTRIDSALSWGLGWGIESTRTGAYG